MNADYKKLLISVLLKKAKGYSYKEKTDEYAIVGGEKQLTKSKVVIKRVQPDVNAVKALLQLDTDETNVTEMTDEELFAEKIRLIKLLDDCDLSAENSDADGGAE